MVDGFPSMDLLNIETSDANIAPDQHGRVFKIWSTEYGIF